MLPIRTIVHPIDFSAADHAALQHSAHFARYHGAALHVVHVAPPMGPLPAYDDGAARATFASYEQAMHGHVASLVRAFLRAASVRGVHVEPVFIPHAVPAAGIVAYAREVEADLLVIGAHSRRGPWAPPLGRVAEEVVRAAPCPVLVVRPEGDPSHIRRIVAALDLTTADEETAAYATALAEVYHARLDLLHVVNRVAHPVPGSSGAEGYAQRIEGLERSAAAELHALREHLGIPRNVSVRVEAGFAPDVVVSCAASNEGQLLVLGRRGELAGRKLDFHGVTEKALQTTPCSLLIIPPEGHRLRDAIVEAEVMPGEGEGARVPSHTFERSRAQALSPRVPAPDLAYPLPSELCGHVVPAVQGGPALTTFLGAA